MCLSTISQQDYLKCWFNVQVRLTLHRRSLCNGRSYGSQGPTYPWLHIRADYFTRIKPNSNLAKQARKWITGLTTKRLRPGLLSMCMGQNLIVFFFFPFVILCPESKENQVRLCQRARLPRNFKIRFTVRRIHSRDYNSDVKPYGRVSALNRSVCHHIMKTMIPFQIFFYKDLLESRKENLGVDQVLTTNGSNLTENSWESWISVLKYMDCRSNLSICIR